jgi:hypothetical protein
VTFYDVGLIREGYSLRFESRAQDHTLDVDVSDISTVEYFEDIHRIGIVTKQNRSWNFRVSREHFSWLKSLLGHRLPEVHT